MKLHTVCLPDLTGGCGCMAAFGYVLAAAPGGWDHLIDEARAFVEEATAELHGDILNRGADVNERKSR